MHYNYSICTATNNEYNHSFADKSQAVDIFWNKIQNGTSDFFNNSELPWRKFG